MPTRRNVLGALSLVGIGFAAGPASADAPDPEAASLRWALSYRASDAVHPSALRELAARPTPDGVDRLVALGEPARRALLRLAGEDDATAERLRPILARMHAREDYVELRGLDHAMPHLLACGPDGVARAHRIEPEGAPAEGLLPWWTEREYAFRWAPAKDRFEAWEPWAADQAPLRFRGRSHVVLHGSEGLVRWSSPVTVECWVRWPNQGPQYLLTDEAWPELKPDVLVTSTKRGFALRRNPRSGGLASLDLTIAISPNHWFSVESAPLAVTEEWEHVAASSDGRVIRLFRNGELVAARAVPTDAYLPGLGDVTIGPREFAMDNRASNLDLRALRISEGARYVDDFVPAQALPADGATVVAPDFTPGDEWMNDRASTSRRAEIVGPTWIPAVDAATARRALTALGGARGEIVVAEAGRGGRSADWYLADRETSSEGVNAEIYGEREPDAAGHWVTVLLRVPKAGAYRVHLLGAGLDHLGATGLVSPFSWRIGDRPDTVATGAIPTIYAADLPGRALSPLGRVSLEAGESVFHLRLLARRARDWRYSIWFDAIVLEALDP